MAYRILQWNIRGEKVNHCDLMLLIAIFCPAVICLQETHQKSKDSIHIQKYTSYNYINDQRNRVSGGSSIIVNNNITQSKIKLKTKLQAIAVLVRLQKTVTFCSLYLPPNDTLDKRELDELIRQLPKPFILMGDFNNHSEMWGNKDTNRRGKIIEELYIDQNQLCLYNNGANTYLHPATGTLSAIDLTICDPSIYMNYHWRVHDETGGSDHFPIILEGQDPERDSKTPRWNIQKADWQGFQKACQGKLTPEANINKEDDITYFTNTYTNNCRTKYSQKFTLF